MEQIILVENNIGIQGGSKTGPLKNESGAYSLILQSIPKTGMAEIQME